MTQPIFRFRTLTHEEQSAYDGKHARPSLVMCADGNLVAYSSFAALAAENERLTRLLLDLSNAVHIHRANANGSKCDAEINRIVAEVDTIFDIQ